MLSGLDGDINRSHTQIPIKLVASLAQSVEHKTFNLRAAGSSPAEGFLWIHAATLFSRSKLLI